MRFRLIAKEFHKLFQMSVDVFDMSEVLLTDLEKQANL